MTFEFKKRPVPRYFRIHPFSFGSKEVEIDKLINMLLECKEAHGTTHLEMNVLGENDYMFYCLKYEEESDDEFLDRLGIKTQEDRKAVLNSLLSVNQK